MEAYKQIPFSTLKLIKEKANNILKPKVTYSEDQLELQKQVIKQNISEANEILNIVDMYF